MVRPRLGQKEKQTKSNNNKTKNEENPNIGSLGVFRFGSKR